MGKKLIFIVFAFILAFGAFFSFINAELDLKLYANFEELNARFVTVTGSSYGSGFDSYDSLFAAPPGNYSKLYSNVSENQLSLDAWNSSLTSRDIILSFEVFPSRAIDYLNFSWSFSDSTNYDAFISQCTASDCSFTSAPVDLETVSLASYLIDSSKKEYFKLKINYNPYTPPGPGGDTGGSGGGGGGGATPRPSLSIDLPKPISLESIGPVDFNITLKNNGNVNFNSVSLTGSMLQNSKPSNFAVTFDNSSFGVFSANRNETIGVHAYVSTEEVTVYEILINASARDPKYTTQAKVYLTFIGKNGSGIVKIIAFTEGLINENAECLDLKDMIEDSRAEFDKGNTAVAIEKAQAALAACKNILDNPRKPTYNSSNQGFIVLLIAIGLGLAIVFGILLNIYKRFIFSKNR